MTWLQRISFPKDRPSSIQSSPSNPAQLSDAEATGWFSAPIDPDALAQAPHPWSRQLNEHPWPVDVDNVDELVAKASPALHHAAREAMQRTRSNAILQTRNDLVDHLATDLAKRGARSPLTDAERYGQDPAARLASGDGAPPWLRRSTRWAV